MAHSASVALGEVGQQSRFGFLFLMLENVSTFLLRLVLTLISLVSSVSSLSALIQLFSSNRFQASLDSFGYLAFCLLFLPLPCCYFSFVASFFCCLFVVYCAVGNGLLVPLSLTRLFAFYLMDVFHLHVSFSCYYFSRVDLRLYNSERRELSTGRVCFVKLWLSGPRSPQNSRRS